jgi:hypothetical protein
LYDDQIEAGVFVDFEDSGNEIPKNKVLNELHVFGTHFLQASILIIQMFPFAVYPAIPLMEATVIQRTIVSMMFWFIAMNHITVGPVFYQWDVETVARDKVFAWQWYARVAIPGLGASIAFIEGTGVNGDLYVIYVLSYVMFVVAIIPFPEQARSALGDKNPWLKGPGKPSKALVLGLTIVQLGPIGALFSTAYSVIDLVYIQNAGGTVTFLRPIFMVTIRKVCTKLALQGISRMRMPWSTIYFTTNFYLMLGKLTALGAAGCRDWVAIGNFVIVDWACFLLRMWSLEDMCEGNPIISKIRKSINLGKLQPLPGMKQSTAWAFSDYIEGAMPTTAFLSLLVWYPVTMMPIPKAEEGLKTVKKLFFPMKGSLMFMAVAFTSTYIQDKVMMWRTMQKSGETFARIYGKFGTYLTLRSVWVTTMTVWWQSAVMMMFAYSLKYGEMFPYNEDSDYTI